ncbi:hypothetical protein Dimus_005862 [Dionaea muscipula]
MVQFSCWMYNNRAWDFCITAVLQIHPAQHGQHEIMLLEQLEKSWLLYGMKQQAALLAGYSSSGTPSFSHMSSLLELPCHPSKQKSINNHG